MTTKVLTEDDIEKLFSGAPQYYARKEANFAGAPHPSVAFPFDEELEIRDVTDHVQIEAKAWAGVTAWPHLTRDANHDTVAKMQAQENHKAHFNIRCRERPNMLSMQGLEKGTVGYQAALELSVSDSLEEEQFGFESVGKKARVIVEARQRMLSKKGWLHRLPENEILERLNRKGELYRDNDLRITSPDVSYNDLFDDLVRPCPPMVDRGNPHSLNNQINALIKCIGTANVWIDLSHVEWRIRLGQILWGEQEGDDLGDATAIHDAESASERAEEKYWLLMQILVAAELLVRLDAITEGHEFGIGALRPIDVVHFERAATSTVKWSLLLARSWMENIEVVKEEVHLSKTSGGLHPPCDGGWLASLACKFSLHHHNHSHDSQPSSSPYHYTIKGRHGQRQVDGLIHFAKKIMWPGIDTYEAHISQNIRKTLEADSTPPRRSFTKDSEESSYFGTWDITHHRGKHVGQVQTQRRRLAAALHTSGWLSKSYVFGLMLPGEALSHFLMATLLENDTEALGKLGSFANLCGGFIYSEKSFWSTSCIVGRVLAAGKGSAECMGWVSTDVVPDGMEDGWVNIDVEDVAEVVAQLGKKARLWGKKKVERESSILGDGDDDSVRPADFIIPYENAYSTPPPNVYVELLALHLSAPAGSVEPTRLTDITATPVTESGTAPTLPSYPASIKFFVSINGQNEEERSYSLSHDITFVTAHPCSPPHRVKFLKSPSSPTIQRIDITGSDALGKGSRSAYRMGHPLHKFYNYSVIHISELLQKPQATLAQFLATSSASKSDANRVLVIDCITSFADMPLSPIMERLETPSSSPVTERKGSFSTAALMHLESRRRQFGSDMEILVRALCAQKGWNAIISRRKRGCLACAIREAGALGWKVILRVD